MNAIWIPEKQHTHTMWKLKKIKRGIILSNWEAPVSCRWNILCLKLSCVPKRYQILLGSSEITHTKHFQFHCSRPIYEHTAFADRAPCWLGWHTIFNAAVGLGSMRLGHGHSSKQVTRALLKVGQHFRKLELSNRITIYSATFLN